MQPGLMSDAFNLPTPISIPLPNNSRFNLSADRRRRRMRFERAGRHFMNRQLASAWNTWWAGCVGMGVNMKPVWGCQECVVGREMWVFERIHSPSRGNINMYCFSMLNHAFPLIVQVCLGPPAHPAH